MEEGASGAHAQLCFCLRALAKGLGPVVQSPLLLQATRPGCTLCHHLWAHHSSNPPCTHLQKPKKKKKQRRRAQTPPDTDEDEEDYDEEGNVLAKARPNAITRARRWWRCSWYHFREKHLRATKRKRMPRWQQAFYDVVSSLWFNNVMTAFIVLNTITLALDHYGISDGMLKVLDNINMGEACAVDMPDRSDPHLHPSFVHTIALVPSRGLAAVTKQPWLALLRNQLALHVFAVQG